MTKGETKGESETSTFEHGVDVVLVVVDAHHVVDVAGPVAVAVLRDDDFGIVEALLDPLERVAHSVRGDGQPVEARPALFFY